MSYGVGRRVVCAANRRADGLIVLGVRHYDPIMRDAIDRLGGHEVWIGCQQGFVDNRGLFMTREEALALAKENGQIIRRCGGDEHRLYSENLY